MKPAVLLVSTRSIVQLLIVAGLDVIQTAVFDIAPYAKSFTVWVAPCRSKFIPEAALTTPESYTSKGVTSYTLTRIVAVADRLVHGRITAPIVSLEGQVAV